MGTLRRIAQYFQISRPTIHAATHQALNYYFNWIVAMTVKLFAFRTSLAFGVRASCASGIDTQL